MDRRRFGRTLKTVDSPHRRHQAHHGLVDDVGVAMDMHESSIGERLQDQPDSARVARRLEDERTLVLPGQLPGEGQQGGFPSLDLLAGGIPKRQVAVVVVGTLREGKSHHRREERHHAQRSFVLGRDFHAQGHVVHAEACAWQEERSNRRYRLQEQEGMRSHHLIDLGKRKPAIDGQQVVQEGRSIPPVPKDKQGFLDGSAAMRRA